MADRDVLTAQDEELAEQLRQKDEAVLTKIDRAYSGKLRQLLRRHRGPALDEDGIDEIVFQSLHETWKDFRAGAGSSVRAFYFRVAKSRLQDRLRRFLRQQELAEVHHPKLATPDVSQEPSPEDRAIVREAQEFHKPIMALIDKALQTRSPRQRTAFLRRFASGGGSNWAQELEKETGVPAKQWRKASDQAKNHVEAYLIEKGVRYSQEGGRYEVA